MSQQDVTEDPRKAIVANELAWHEQESQRRFSLDRFLYAAPAFDRIVQSSFTFLQMKPGELVLDMGCGEGKETLLLARQGLTVISTDLSRLQLGRARQLMQEKAANARVCFVQANAEELPFAANSFRIIYGKAILHHLDLGLSAQEVKRLLRQDGRASFAEPLAHHPLFWAARRLTPQLHTKDEHPLPLSELRRFGAHFGQAEIEVYFLFAPVSYAARRLPGAEHIFRRLHSLLQDIDQWLFDHFRALKELAWYGLVKVEK